MIALFAKHTWKVLFLFTGAAAVWIGARALLDLTTYYQLSHEAIATPLHFGVVSSSDEKNYIYADYQFSVGSELITARYVYQKPVYQSRAAAESMLQDKKGTLLRVWYKKPNKSVLERNFPTKDLVRLGAALCILIYFVLLKNYLQNFESNLVS